VFIPELMSLYACMYILYVSDRGADGHLLLHHRKPSTDVETLDRLDAIHSSLSASANYFLVTATTIVKLIS